MKRHNRYFPFCFILCICSLIISGCSSLIQELQDWTGNRIEIVDDVTTTIDDDDDFRKDDSETDPSESIKSPKAHLKLDKILKDEGRGKYAGEQFDREKINEALDLLPKGLTEEKVYAYLLGLVGENYYKEKDLLDEIAHSNYNKQFVFYQNKKAKQSQSAQSGAINVVFLLDASNSMNNMMDGKKKIQLAKEAALTLAQKLPVGTYYTFRIYGRQSDHKPTSCLDSEKKVSTKLNGNLQKISKEIKSLQPKGWSPLSKAIENAYIDLKENAARSAVSHHMIFVISDNTDSCGEDPVKASKKLNKTSKIKPQIHFIGLDVSAEAEKDFKKITEVSNGNFEVVTNQAELKQVLHLHTEEILRMNEPWQMKATDKITRNYVADKSRLRYHVEKISNKVQQEYERLSEANQYIKEKQKIDGEDWLKLNDMIDHRRSQVENYADSRLQQISSKLDQDFNQQTQKIKQSWSSEGKDVQTIEARKNQRLKALEKTQQPKKESNESNKE